METLRTLAGKSTGEDKRCLVEKVEEVRKAIVGLGKQARGEELQRVAESEENLKKLEEEMLTWSVEEQEQRRQEEQEEQRRQEEQEQRRHEEQEHAAMRNAATGERMAAKTTAVTSVTTGTRDKNTDETRKGKGKGNGGKGEHASRQAIIRAPDSSAAFNCTSVRLSRTYRNVSPSGSNVERTRGPHKYLSFFCGRHEEFHPLIK